MPIFGRRSTVDIDAIQAGLEEKQQQLLKQIEGIDLSGKKRRGRFWRGLLFGGVLGAGALYLFDPEQGESRRRNLVGAASSLGGASSDLPDRDQFVTGKVETELFRDSSIPKGQININTVDGVVYVRGTANNQGQIAEIERRIKQIDGVDAVINLLRLPATG